MFCGIWLVFLEATTSQSIILKIHVFPNIFSQNPTNTNQIVFNDRETKKKCLINVAKTNPSHKFFDIHWRFSSIIESLLNFYCGSISQYNRKQREFFSLWLNWWVEFQYSICFILSRTLLTIYRQSHFDLYHASIT